MKSTKTLNVSTDIHQRVKVKAAENRWQIGEFTDTIIEVGLKHEQEVNDLLQERQHLANNAK